MLAWATGLSRDVADDLTREGVLSIPESFADIANDDDELRIAARIGWRAAAAPDPLYFGFDRGIKKYEAPALDKLASEVSEYIRERYGNRRAHEQGELAARYVREKLDLEEQTSFAKSRMRSTGSASGWNFALSGRPGCGHWQSTGDGMARLRS